MDNTNLAIKLLRYTDEKYPLNHLRREEFREQSARRWAIFEYVTSLLDKPSDSPTLLLELMIGRLACMISHLSLSNKDEMLKPYRSALSTLIIIEEQMNNGVFR